MSALVRTLASSDGSLTRVSESKSREFTGSYNLILRRVKVPQGLGVWAHLAFHFFPSAFMCWVGRPLSLGSWRRSAWQLQGLEPSYSEIIKEKGSFLPELVSSKVQKALWMSQAGFLCQLLWPEEWNLWPEKGCHAGMGSRKLLGGRRPGWPVRIRRARGPWYEMWDLFIGFPFRYFRWNKLHLFCKSQFCMGFNTSMLHKTQSLHSGSLKFNNRDQSI